MRMTSIKKQRYVSSAWDEGKVKALITAGGFHYAEIARWIWGKGSPRYVVSSAEISRVQTIASSAGVSSRDWRNGKTAEAKRVLKAVMSSKSMNLGLRVVTPKLKLKVA